VTHRSSAQYKFAAILGTIEPLRREVDTLREAGRSAEEELAALTAQGLELEHKIEGYKGEYASLISQAQTIKTEMAKVKEKVRVRHIPPRLSLALAPRGLVLRV